LAACTASFALDVSWSQLAMIGMLFAPHGPHNWPQPVL
jgi:hypothetical protein